MLIYKHVKTTWKIFAASVNGVKKCWTSEQLEMNEWLINNLY